MLKSLTSLVVLFALTLNAALAQTTEEMQAMKDEKSKELATLETQLAELTGKVNGLKTEVATLTDKLTPYPRWTVGALGTVGLNFAGFNDWLSKDQPNTTASTIGFTINSFANLQQKKYFWRNSGNLNLSWLKFDNKDDNSDNEEFQVASDALNLSSLYGFEVERPIYV